MADYYKLSPEEMEIISRSADDPNIFFDYFFRKPGQEHGWQLDKGFRDEGVWQKKMCMAAETFIVAVCGIATGKTLGVVMSAAYHAVLTPGFKFLNVAKEAWQSMLMYKALLEQAEGTLFEKLIIEKPRRPYPMVRIGYEANGIVIQGTLEFMSLGESGDGSNIFSWRGDWINIEEAGRIDELAQLVTMLVTRLTGVTAAGRTFMGRLSLISNPWENIDLWNLLELARGDPEGLVIETDTSTNTNVSQKQIDLALKLIPPEQRDRFLSSKRPPGRGTWFPDVTVSACESDLLTEMLTKGIAAGTKGYEMTPLAGSGLASFMIPRQPDRIYIVIGDPGTGAAPARNAPTLMVLDVTDAPISAPIVCLWWGNGYGKIEPFVTKTIELIQHYCPIYAGVDSTSNQKNAAELINMQYIYGKNLSVPEITGLDFSGNRKIAYLVSAKLLLESVGITWPSLATGISQQLRNYDPQEDKLNSKLPQDLVSCVGMASWVIRLLFGWPNDDTDAQSDQFTGQTTILRGSRSGYTIVRSSRALPGPGNQADVPSAPTRTVR